MTTVFTTAARVNGIEIPLGTRSHVLADLRARLDNAEALIEQAVDAGDAAKEQRALERWYLRAEQIEFVTNRPAGALCPSCEWGAERWPQGVLLDRGTPIESCLVHMLDVHEARAALAPPARRERG